MEVVDFSENINNLLAYLRKVYDFCERDIENNVFFLNKKIPSEIL